MKASTAAQILSTLAAFNAAQAQVSEWGQCGGTGYTGATTCAAGLTCQVQNAYYSQCLPGTASSVPVTSTAKPTTTVAPTTTVKPTTTAPAPASTGFVKTSGQKFMLNGAEYIAVGANAYWVGLMGYTTAEMNQAFADIAAAGGTTVRTWGFNDVTSPSGDYYQLWTNGVPSINTGSTGLENFDNVVAAAKANGIRLIVTLTNNWSDYGGMDVYVNQLVGQGQGHDLFYTNAAVQAAYKNYVKTFVSRYVNEPTILGWELANEPRCQGSTSATTGNCTTATITNWATTMSAYIKSVDSNHLVGIGDEGFINDPGNPSYPYQGYQSALGVDFGANIKISSIDFGTFHMYPESWGETANETLWGVQWIDDHAAIQKSANKPVLLEEFGALNNQVTIYTQWYNAVLSSGLTGDLIWQAGSNFTYSDTPNDGYAVYPGTAVYSLESQYAAKLKARG